MLEIFFISCENYLKVSSKMFKFIYYLIFNKNNKTIDITFGTIDGLKTWNSYMAILCLSIISIVDTIDGFGYRWWLFCFPNPIV